MTLSFTAKISTSPTNCHGQNNLNLNVNPQAPVAQKIADKVVFRRFQGEGVKFFKIGPH